jgi:mannose-6-phosphate isomerase-like protein (cupin superfamily)
MKPSKPHFVNKIWGHETWFANNEQEDYCGKVLRILKGKSTSMHLHLNKHETFYVLTGTLHVDVIDTIDGTVYSVLAQENECMEMPRGTPHRLIANNEDVTLIEVSTHHKDTDSLRIHP